MVVLSAVEDIKLKNSGYSLRLSASKISSTSGMTFVELALLKYEDEVVKLHSFRIEDLEEILRVSKKLDAALENGMDTLKEVVV